MTLEKLQGLMVDSDRVKAALALLKHYGQEHVMNFFDTLDADGQTSLLSQIEGIDFHRVFATILPMALKAQSSPGDITPFPPELTQRIPTEGDNERFRRLASPHLTETACLLLAGGQGTRLGFAGPKGTYPYNSSGTTLFDVIVARAISLYKREGRGCPRLLVMTSPSNHNDTVDFFRNRSYYGLPSERFTFFAQGVLPCLSLNHKIMLSSPSDIAFAPDGNGGVYSALRPHLPTLRAEGVKYLHVFGVDNVLVKPADPVFIGACIEMGAEVGNKVLWKASPGEKVGVMALDSEKRPCVVEYSDMPEETKVLTDASGSLVYGAGNICNHFYTLDFLERIVPNIDNAVSFHVAKKKIPHVDHSGCNVEPASPNGIKLETFIFDVFPHARLACLEVARECEFAPIKSADDPILSKTMADSPKMAKAMITALSKQRIAHAAKRLDLNINAVCDALKKYDSLEISPATSLDGRDLQEYHINAIIQGQGPDMLL